MKQKLKANIKNSPVIVHDGRYAYLKSNVSSLGDNYFMVSRDQDEVTIVVEEKDIQMHQYSAETKWFKLIEIQTSSPFIVPGFIAAIATAIAKRDLTLLVVSTYSKDYILLHEQDLDQGLKSFEQLGFSITR